jgi:hypothetical protein
MPMPDPTGDTGKGLGFLNRRRVLVLLSVVVFVLVATVIWLVFTVMSLKRDRDNAGARAHVDAHSRAIALVESKSH